MAVYCASLLHTALPHDKVYFAGKPEKYRSKLQ